MILSAARATPVAEVNARPWVKPLCDFGPLVVFFAAFYLGDLMVATAAVMIATLLALALSYAMERRIALMPLITAVIIGVFGGLTLWLQDETFFKMKPTIVQSLFAIILLGGMAFGRPLLKPLMGPVWALDDTGWRKLTLRFGLFFVAMALLNELVWRSQSTEFWVNFKVFGIMGLTLVFTVSQVFLLQQHQLEPETGSEGDKAEDGTDRLP